MINVDVVIIGSGLAGLNSALQAARYGKVLVITKSRITESNSRYAQGGIAGVFEKNDNYQQHVEDTMKAGAGHNDRKAVRYFIEQAPDMIGKLGKMGVKFEKTTGENFAVNREAGHKFSRVAHAGDHTGRSIMEVLVQKVRRQKNITVWDNTFALDLIVKGKTCFGVAVVRRGKYSAVIARRTILATGGCGQLFKYTTNPKVTTGDGLALAARAGCRLKDMEFIQFHPTAFAEGKSPLFLLSETLRGENARLVNSKGERFMPRYHPQAELAPRDIVSQAMYEEQKKGPVSLDIRHYGREKLRKKFPTISDYLLKKGYDMSTDLIPVTPAAHYLCGGIKTDVHGKTGLGNLYALGETACTGLHGANRLASNSLLEAAVMSEHVMDAPLPVLKNVPRFTDKKRNIKPPSKTAAAGMRSLRNKIQEIMWNCAGIVRTKNLLKKAQLQLLETRKQLSKYPDCVQKFELQNMIEVSEIIVKSAAARKKGLGSHFLLV